MNHFLEFRLKLQLPLGGGLDVLPEGLGSRGAFPEPLFQNATVSFAHEFTVAEGGA